MARRFILEVRKAPYSPKAPYLVHVPKSLHAAEGAQRRFFEKEAIARAYVKRLPDLPLWRARSLRGRKICE
jgi:hypothetical protein